MIDLIFLSTDDYQFGVEDQSVARAAIETVEPAIRMKLPMLARKLIVTIYPGPRVIPETGHLGRTVTKDWIQVTVNPQDAQGVQGIFQTHLPSCFAHEAHHAARSVAAAPSFDGRVLSAAVSEGLATAFQEEVTGVALPWGQYDEAQADAWLVELQELPVGTDSRPWRFRHPDGRRWIAYRAGKRLVDLAKLHSGQTAAEMVGFSADEVMALSRI